MFQSPYVQHIIQRSWVGFNGHISNNGMVVPQWREPFLLKSLTSWPVMWHLDTKWSWQFCVLLVSQLLVVLCRRCSELCVLLSFSESCEGPVESEEPVLDLPCKESPVETRLVRSTIPFFLKWKLHSNSNSVVELHIRESQTCSEIYEICCLYIVFVKKTSDFGDLWWLWRKDNRSYLLIIQIHDPVSLILDKNMWRKNFGHKCKNYWYSHRCYLNNTRLLFQ